LAKEWRSEMRARAGLATTALFSFGAVVAVATAAFNLRVDASLGAGLFWVVAAFAAAVGLPRTFLGEEEQGTGDLLRLAGAPAAVFAGKAAYNAILLLAVCLLLAALFVGFVGLRVVNPALFLASVGLGSLALSGAMSIVAALVAQGENRALVAGAAGIPLLLPILLIGVSATRGGFDEIYRASAERSTLGLLGYALLMLVIGGPIYTAVNRR
jgi:heme exporter protein B